MKYTSKYFFQFLSSFAKKELIADEEHWLFGFVVFN